MGELFENLSSEPAILTENDRITGQTPKVDAAQPFDGGERSSLAPVEAETNNRALCQTRDITWSCQKQDDPPSEFQGGDAVLTHQTGISEAAPTFKPKGAAADVCARKHKGNPNSVAAFESVSKRLNESQNRIWNCIKDAGERGRTNDEICIVLGLYPNEVSGRITELYLANRIEEIGKRLTRRKCSASVWRTI